MGQIWLKMREIVRGDGKPKSCVAYDEDGVCIAVGDSIHDLARQLHVTTSAVSHGLNRHSPRYAFVDLEGEEDE